MPLISIIIPIYNVEPYLERCIRSVLNQTYTNLQIILINDGSTDNCPSICNAFAEEDKRISVIHQENKGLSVARNVGIKNAKGLYIWFVDSDDIIINNAVEILVEKLRNSDCDLLLFERDIINEGSDMNLLRFDDVIHRKYDYSELSGKCALQQQYKNGDYDFQVCTYICRRSFLDEAKLLFKAGLIYEDVLFSIKAFLFAKKIRVIHDTLYLRSVRSNSTMRSLASIKSFSSLLYIFRELTVIGEYKEYFDVKGIISEIADSMLQAGLNKGMELALNPKIKFDDLQSILDKHNITLPSFELSEKNVVYYGGGNMCRLLLSAVPERPNEIWDKNADSIGNTFGVDCVKPRFGGELDSIIVICIAEQKNYHEIENQFRSLGYNHICSCGEYFFLVKSEKYAC